jgi:outer membrane biosynthesis protein TonB
VSFRPVGPPPDQRPPSFGERLLGGPDSWRRVILFGLGGGLVVAFVAAFAWAVLDDDSGPLEIQASTPAAPLAGPVGDTGDVAPPDDAPVEEAPIDEGSPADEPPADDVPPTEPPPTVAEPPTEAPPPTEPAATPVIEEPTAAATAEGG